MLPPAARIANCLETLRVGIENPFAVCGDLSAAGRRGMKDLALDGSNVAQELQGHFFRRILTNMNGRYFGHGSVSPNSSCRVSIGIGARANSSDNERIMRDVQLAHGVLLSV